MIVAGVEAEYEIVTQGDHAHLSAELLALFRLPELVEHPRREQLIRAAREHDSGWRRPDAAPRVDPRSGRPLGFREITGDLRREIWARSCALEPGHDPYVSLLINLHADYLHRDRNGIEDWDGWLRDLRSVRDELLTEVGIEASEARADYAWLRLADACSLALCERREQAFSCSGFEASAQASSLRLAPFPLAGTTTFKVPCRRVAGRAYDSDREFGKALASARWQYRPVTVAPTLS